MVAVVLCGADPADCPGGKDGCPCLKNGRGWDVVKPGRLVLGAETSPPIQIALVRQSLHLAPRPRTSNRTAELGK